MKGIKQKIKNKLTNKAILKYPLIVTHIRSGMHFLMKLIETYTGKERFRITIEDILWIYKKEWGFVHTHFHNDWNLLALNKIEQNNIKFVYLYRGDYLSVVFSKIMYDIKNNLVDKHKAFTKENVKKHISNYEKHVKKFTKNKNAIIIRYEHLINKKKRLSEFKKVIDFLGYAYEEKRAKEVFEMFSEVNLSDERNKHEDTNYEKKREWFKNKFGDKNVLEVIKNEKKD